MYYVLSSIQLKIAALQLAVLAAVEVEIMELLVEMLMVARLVWHQ